MEASAKWRLDRLRILSTPKATVIREGAERSIDPSRLVRGDLVVIGRGDQVPLDGELVDGQIEVDESLLTGESDPAVRRQGEALLSGSVCVSGRGVDAGHARRPRQLREPADRAGAVDAHGAHAAPARRRPVDRRDDGPRRPGQRRGRCFLQVRSRGDDRLDRPDRGRPCRARAPGPCDHDHGDLRRRRAAHQPRRRPRAAHQRRRVDEPRRHARARQDRHDHRSPLRASRGPSGRGRRGSSRAPRRRRRPRPCLPATGSGTRCVGGSPAPATAERRRRPAAPAQAIDPPPSSMSSPSRRRDAGRASSRQTRARRSCSGRRRPSCRRPTDPALTQTVERWTDRGLRVVVLTRGGATSLRDASGQPALPQALSPVAVFGFAEEIRPDARETLRAFESAGVAIKVVSGDNPRTVAHIAQEAGLEGAERARVNGPDLAAVDDAALGTAGRARRPSSAVSNPPSRRGSCTRSERGAGTSRWSATASTTSSRSRARSSASRWRAGAAPRAQSRISSFSATGSRSCRRPSPKGGGSSTACSALRRCSSRERSTCCSSSLEPRSAASSSRSRRATARSSRSSPSGCPASWSSRGRVRSSRRPTSSAPRSASRCRRRSP